MRDSSGMQEQKHKSTDKESGGKSWMIIAGILLIATFVLGVTEFLAYQDIAKKDDEITNLKKTISDMEAKSVFGADLDGSGLAKVLYIDSNKDDYPDFYLEDADFFKISKDGKYIYGQFKEATSDKSPSRVGGIRMLVYKTLPDGEWKVSDIARNGILNCKDYSEEEAEILIDNGGEKCMDDNSKADDAAIDLEDYYDKKH